MVTTHRNGELRKDKTSFGIVDAQSVQNADTAEESGYDHDKSRTRQIVGFDVQFDKGAFRLQGIVDNAPEAENYSTDGNLSYLDVIFPGKHIRNIRDKRDTHIIESINADLRHYISGLARRSRCFYRSLDTLRAVLTVFIDAYNKYGEAKLKYRVPVNHKSKTPNKHLHKFRQPSFAIIDFL